MKHRIAQKYRQFMALTISLIIAGFSSLSPQVQAEETIRHIITKGDTLWDISEQYLEKPWLWPELWEQNTYIENPHLIFPDDVLLISPSSIRLIRNTRMRTDKLRPRIREISSLDAITTIDASAILPFLNQSVILEEGALDSAAYVLQGVNGEIILGGHSRFYANNLTPVGNNQFSIFRIGRIIANPSTKTRYGIEGVHLGNASLLEHNGKIATLEITSANQEIRPGDRLVPLDKPTALPHYFPHRPKFQIDTQIIMIPKGVNEAGRRDIVVVESGDLDQLEEGHVLEVYSHKNAIKDPITGKLIDLPDSKIATALIFKVYQQVSYAILMQTSAPVKIGDRASTP